MASTRTDDSHHRRSARASSAVLSATRELIAELPYPRITVEGIAARAGVGKQTIYRWWPSKGAVVVDALAARNPDDLTFPDTGDLRADMAAILRATEEEFASPEFDALYRALTIESLQDPELRRIIDERMLGPQFAAARVRFRSAREAGQLRTDVEDSVVFEMFMAPLLHRWQTGAHPLGAAHGVSIADLAIRALSPEQ